MRKKTACFLAAMLFTTSMYAMKEITGEFQPWDGNSVVNGNTLNFLGEWNGMTFKFFDDEGCVYEGGLDLSGYDVIVLKMSDTSCMFKMKVEYTDGTEQQDSWGTEAAAQPGALIAAVPLNSAHKDMVKDFFIQSAKYPGTITIDKIYACTSAEYAQLLAENKATKFNLTLKKIEEGGGSSYNPDTHTITIESDGSHKGWYFDSEYRDFSAFKSFVADFQTSSAGELCVEYDDNTSTSAPFEAGLRERKRRRNLCSERGLFFFRRSCNRHFRLSKCTERSGYGILFFGWKTPDRSQTRYHDPEEKRSHEENCKIVFTCGDDIHAKARRLHSPHKSFYVMKWFHCYPTS